MKKIISLGIASAVLALTAMTASAGVVATAEPAQVKKGDTITVTFTTDAPVTAFASFKTEATGATLVSATSPMIDYNAPLNEQMTQIVDNSKFGTVGAVATGTVLMVQTYTVTAEAGQPVTVNIIDAEGLTGANVNLTVEVGNGQTSDSGSESTPSTSDPSSETPSSSDNSGSTSNPGGDTPPNTGVALAVFPAIIAGAAVVVAKKRK